MNTKPPTIDYDFDNIPQSLKDIQSWVLWRYHWDGNRWTKPPFNVHSLRHNPTTVYSLFNHAVDVYNDSQKTSNPFDGIGLQLFKEQQITILDLDNKPSNPATESELNLFRKLCERFETYTELSPSGTGVHIVCQGNLPLKRDGKTGRHLNSFEAYDRERYMCFTGRSINNLAVTHCQLLLSSLIREMDARRGFTEHRFGYTALVEIEPKESDEQLMQRLTTFKSWPKIQALANMTYYDAGRNDNTPSQMDIDFLTLVANSTPSNEQVRRIFKTTLLGQREKHQVKRSGTSLVDMCLTKIRTYQAEKAAQHKVEYDKWLLSQESNKTSTPHAEECGN